MTISKASRGLMWRWPHGTACTRHFGLATTGTRGRNRPGSQNSRPKQTAYSAFGKIDLSV